jgi:hypothetical protein
MAPRNPVEPTLGEPEERTQDEVRDDAARAPDDPVTRREELELDLMEDEASEAGEHLGQQQG